MFSKTDFQEWGKKNAILFAAVMTKIDGRKDDALLRKYGFSGFPSLAILDHNGTAVCKKVQRTLGSMSALVTKSKQHLAMQAKVEAGEAHDKTKWFMSRLDMGTLNLAQAKKEIADLELSDEQRKSAGQQIFAMELSAMQNKRMQQMRARRRGRGANADGATEEMKPIDVEGFVYRSYKAGKRLPKDHGMQGMFDSMLVNIAMQKGDGPAFLYAYDRVKKSYESSLKRMEGMLARYEKMDGERAAMMIPRIKSSVERFREMISNLDASAAKFKK